MNKLEEFVLKTAENYFNVVKLSIDQKSAELLSEFIHNPQPLLLQTCLEKGNFLRMCTNITRGKNKSLVFYKTTATEITNSNEINIMTLSDAPSESLYQVLKHIYAPLLFEENEVLTSNIQQSLSELESNLRIVTYKNDKEKCNVILSIEDEEDYWRTLSQSRDVSKKEKEAATNFCELFEDITEELKSMQTNPMSENRETVENIGGLLDDVWRLSGAAYPQDRMKHLFDVIGYNICSTIQKTLAAQDIWEVFNDSKDGEIVLILSESHQVVSTWNNACLTLTGTYWPNYALRSWSGQSYVAKYCINFQARLVEILNVRSSHNQLNKLLTSNEKMELKTDQLFSLFQSINVWNCNGANKSWELALAKFTANFMPAETKVAEKLKPRLHNTSTKQMLYEFMRYKSLIVRPIVKRALNSELEIFVTSLNSLLKSVRRQIEEDDVTMYQPTEMSPVVQRVQWAKQMEAKVAEIHSCAEKYLNEFEGSTELIKMAYQLMTELKNLYTQLHEDWSRNLQAQVKNGSLQLAVDKPVVEFSQGDNMMVVNFSPGAVAAAAEIRSMTALKLPPPPGVTEAMDTLVRLLHHARYLQQVASFHNTMGERMIPSTRPMMLQAALDLSSLVQDQKAVYWDNEAQVKNYTNQLKQVVMKLESQNSYLTSQHVAIRNIVLSLVDTELLAKQAEWKKKVKQIRDIVEKVESNGYKNTELWRSHWDWQLYKALECQYMKTLMSLHKHFPHVKVDLVLRGQRVKVHPSIEEIRVQHYNQLRRFVSMPAQFVGLQNPIKEGGSIFKAIVDKHSWLGNKSVGELEATISKLEGICEEWTRRAALACVTDLEGLCKQHLHSPEDWELNFKACKAYGQAVAKMTFEDEKIDWISVGTVGLRREFEAQVRNLWSCLISSLQASCREDVVTLDSFMANATLALENKIMPKNAKELSHISAKQQALKEKMPEMEKTVEELKKKGHMLRTWGGDPSVDGTLREWRNIRELMLSHQQMFEHQAEIVKSSLTGEWDNLNTTVDAWLSRWTQKRVQFESAQNVTYEELRERFQLVDEANQTWATYCSEKSELLKECEKFSMNLNVPDTWQQAEKLMAEDQTLWSPFREFDEDLKSLAEQEWVVFQKKLHLLDEFIAKWNPKLEPFTTITLFMQQELEKYIDLTPLLKYLRGTDFTERHWREVFSLLEMECKKPDTLLLGDFLAVALNIKRHVKALQKISASATSESAIRSALSELELWFAGARLPVAYYKDKGQVPVPIVKDYKDIVTKIEEHQWVVSSVRGGEDGAGAAGGAGSDAAAAWDSRLRSARALLRAMHHAQRRWLYLEPILSTDDGELGAKFRRVDHGYRQVARTLENDPRLSALLQSARLQPTLDSISEQLLACQSALNQYIDEKRMIFPRLYFLSDDDLLELLGQARAGAEGRELVMQNHLKKLFPGITGVKLGPDCMSITALCSQHGEVFSLVRPVDIDCAVEVWLKNLESEMRSSLKSTTLKCLQTNSLQEQDPYSLPTQILCLAQNIRFTEQAEKAITSKELRKLKESIDKENLYYVESEVEDENEMNKRQALILQCTYYLTVIKTLIDNNVVSTSHWLWQKQLRIYLLGNKEIVARMGLAEVSYSYEYLGVNTGQFVRTELADECFLVLTQALHLGLVGNPFGPAGTGKTESVKALGGLVGRLVLVFNCDEAMDAKCMGRLLTGLALCGAWGCFDEFNRLTAETLAAVSHQFCSLLDASSSDNPEALALLNGKKVKVSPWCGVAATMNPVGRGYGGRRALPAALERVLRPIAMMSPKGDELAKHLFAAKAVVDAESLATDLHQVFSLASELLTSEHHYDWGLRALKAAIGSFGSALNTQKCKDLIKQRALLCCVLRLNNRSKLTHLDALRFESILSMVFSDIKEDDSEIDPIRIQLESSVHTLGLVANKLQLQKCVELYEQLQQRMGVVVVGPPGSGKTTIRQILKTALTLQGKTIVEYVICPKAMSRSCLLGNIDHDTRQWTDGVISATALEISNQSSDVWSWIVCDGDIDPEWIEALNSVLDDNRLLTLPSGWRIQFPTNVNFIFETHSLEHASPATVSRMGIILLGDENSCAQEVLDNWVGKVELENEMAKMALPLLQRVIKRCLQWLSKHRTDLVMKTCNVALVKQILIQFEHIAQNIGVSVMNTSPEDLVHVAVDRSFKGLLKPNVVDSFQQEMSDELGAALIAQISPGEWIDETLYLSPRLALLEPAIRAVLGSNNSHLLVVGPGSSAKNLLTEYVLRSTTSSLVVAIDCTPVLEPADIIEELKRHNVSRSGGRGGVTTLFVRGLHRARRDHWQSAPVPAMLLQIIQHGGFWESIGAGGSEGARGVQWCALGSVRVVATVAPGTPLCPRLSGALCVITVPEPEEEELLELAKSYLQQNVDKSITVSEISNVTKAMLSMFKEITETFDSQTHYKWNASDIQRWCANIKWHSPSTMADILMALKFEASSIFKDRLTTDRDKLECTAIINNYFKESADFYYTPKLRGAGVFLEVSEKKEWSLNIQKVINQCLTEHEHSVFGDSGAEVCSELALLCPAIAQTLNGGVAVIVSTAGVGRTAAAHIVATSIAANLLFVNHCIEFKTQFKNALSSAGSDGNRTLIFVSESAIDINVLGEIEALIRARSIFAVPRDIMPSLSHSQPTTHFLENVKQNLGIVISLDKDQSNLLEIFEKFPLLYKDCHLIWLNGWSEVTVREMPTMVVERLKKENTLNGSKEDHDSIPVEGFVKIYNSFESNWMQTPCRYVNFIKTFYHIVRRKRAALMQRQKMLSSGVEALRRAKSEVASLQAEASEQELALSDKQAKANQALDQISATVRAATDKKEEMHELKRNIEIENDKLQIRKKEIEAQLASVEPVIAAARAAVGDIKTESLSEVRSLRAPPDVVRDVLEGVLRLMGIADTSWHSMKSFLSKRGVKEDIRCLDASQITPEAAQSVQRLLERRGASFEEKTAKRASAACAPLAAWVRANVAYVEALAKVQPLQREQRLLANNLQEAEDQLAALSSGLLSVDERVASLKDQLGKHTRDAAALELKLSNAKGTITAAETLLEQLAQEYGAWELDLLNISREILELNARSLLAAAYIVYLPDATEPQARLSVSKWSSLIGFENESFSVINFLSNTEKQLKWDADGLPLDKSAIKNAILIDQILESQKCGFTPLIIDPDGEAMSWLKNTLADVSCDFVSQQSDKLNTAVQYAVRLGRILIITEVDAIHQSWAPLLRGLPIGGATTKILLYTRDATLPLRLPPHQKAVLSLIHFTARVDGLTDQLVHYALQEQNPQVNEKTREIKLKKATLQKQQYELQENLLKDLSSNSDILHDANLLASLNKTRSSSNTIAEALQSARALEQATNEACEAFELTAKKTAILVLAVKELTGQRPLVALPVDAALEVYVEAVMRGGNDPKNLNNAEIIRYVTRRVIERVLLGLHKKDKYTVVLHLLKQVNDQIILDDLWKIFIGTTEFVEDTRNLNDVKQTYPWLTEAAIRKLATLEMTSPEVYSNIQSNTEKLKQFTDTGDLNIIRGLKLGPFESVLAVAIFRPASLYRAVVAFVDQLLGAGVMSAGNEIQSGARWGAGAVRGPRPLLLLGAHAADQLASHATAQGTTLTQTWIDSGRAEWERAVGANRNSWVALLVGASPFSAELQAYITALALAQNAEDLGPDFRLWIVSEDREIPPLVSNSCVNIILEAPEGMKNNVLTTLAAWGDYESPDLKLVRMHVCLAFLHALLQERRAYIPEGWSRHYPFEWGDIAACTRIIRALGTSVAARGLVGALYAGRVAPRDRQLLAVLVAECLGEHTMAHAWRPRGVTVPLPFGKQLQAYTSALSELPNIDSPEILGLPADCRAAWERRAARDILVGLKELNSAVLENKKADGGNSLRPLLALWKRLMAGNPLLKGDLVVQMEGWWGLVCAGEARRGAAAARAVHATLAAIARQKNNPATLLKAPEDWQVLWCGPESPEQYVRELAYRANAAVKRIHENKGQGDHFPTELDLRSFFQPRRALAAIRAHAAQLYKCPPEALSLQISWGEQNAVSQSQSALSVQLSGLLLRGAEWRGSLFPAPGATLAPPLLLHYVQHTGTSSGSSYQVPLYTAESDTALVLAAAPLAAGFDAALATLNAVALVVAPVDAT